MDAATRPVSSRNSPLASSSGSTSPGTSPPCTRSTAPTARARGPRSSLGSDGALYGTADGGPDGPDNGVVFKVSANVVDADADSIDDARDNCLGVYNPSQLDTNQDGFLDVDELHQWQKRAPDLEFVVRIGKLGPNELPTDLLLPEGLHQNAADDGYRADKFFRFNENLQRYFDLSASVETTFDPSSVSSARSKARRMLRRMRVASSMRFRPGATCAQSSWPK